MSEATYKEIIDLSMGAIESKEDDDERGRMLIASADVLAQYLMRPFLDKALESSREHKISIPSFMLFPGAFKIAYMACIDFFKEKAPEGFWTDSIEALDIFVKFSEKSGFLSRWYEANRKGGEDDNKT